MEWFYANEKDQQVAINEVDLPRLVANGIVRRDTLVWHEGLEDWVECAALRPELFEAVEPAGDGRQTGPGFGDSGPAKVPPIPAENPLDPAGNIALFSLVLGILGLALCLCLPILAAPCSIGAVVAGHISKKKLTDAGKTEKTGLATAGLVTGYVGIGIVVLSLLAMIAWLVFTEMETP